MNRENMWEEIVKAGESGLKEEFDRLPDNEIESMTVDECILKCYSMVLNPDTEYEVEWLISHYGSEDFHTETDCCTVKQLKAMTYLATEKEFMEFLTGKDYIESSVEEGVSYCIKGLWKGEQIA